MTKLHKTVSAVTVPNILKLKNVSLTTHWRLNSAKDPKIMMLGIDVRKEKKSVRKICRKAKRERQKIGSP